MSYSDELRIPAWTAHYLQGQPLNIPRPDEFHEDDEVPEQVRSRLADYHLSGYDRGHMTPNGDMRYFSEASVQQAFLLSNIAPQAPATNRGGAWLHAEMFGRDALATFEKVYIVTGTMIINEDESDQDISVLTIGDSQVVVPTHFFRMHIALKDGKPIVAAFVIPQTAGRESELSEAAVTVDTIEASTGLDFFTTLPDDEEDALESTILSSDWP